MDQKKINKILGWLAFLIAFLTYAFTMERTGSLWDCGEFLSCTYKMQVAHPPGTPMYMMIGKIFSLLSFGDETKVAMFINLLSAFSSAFCAFFFYHSSVILLNLLFNKKGEAGTRTQMIMFASFIGAVASGFLDSMWFNSIEGEVYALSIFFTTFNVWAALRWYTDDSEKADYWLLIIGLMTGISIGVHLLALLTFPFIGLLIYYKKFKETRFGGFIAFFIGVIMMFYVMKFILSFTSGFLGKMDMMFVNTLGLPFFSGSIFGIVLIILGVAFLIKKSSDNRNFLRWNEDKMKFPLNTVLLFLAFMYMGYMSNFQVVIRANANPPINMNVPNNFITLQSYLNREQYGDRSLLYGPQYPNSREISSVDNTGDLYYMNKSKGIYEQVGKKKKYSYISGFKKFFPRMPHERADHINFYRIWNNPKYDVFYVTDERERTMDLVETFGEGQLKEAEQFAQQQNSASGGLRYVVKDRITFFDNIKFFVKYQLGFMYFRYLMWNTAGRVDEDQGRVSNDKGRWTSGISFVDNLLGDFWGNVKLDQSKREVSKYNKANNNFYMIPFFLCVLGMIYSYKHDRKLFWALLILMFTTGLMKVIQDNSPPVEPRERDYALAPSFWAFVLWLPFGIMMIYDFLKSKVSAKPAMIVSLLIGLAAPVLMGTQGWDDHDRSNRTTTRDFAVNMLNSCPPNAILFCYGDNDTYPLWYVQEVEGVREDVRVINTSLIEGDAYISQLRLPMNKSKAVKLTLSQDKVKGETNQYVKFIDNPLSSSQLSMNEVLEFIASDDPRSKTTFRTYDGKTVSEDFIPTKNVYLKLDAEKVKKGGFYSVVKGQPIPERIEFTIPGSMYRGSLIQLDVITNNMYDRPICFASSNPSVRKLGVGRYLEQHGVITMFNPLANAQNGAPQNVTDPYKMFESIKKWKFGGITQDDILYDEHTRISMTNLKQPLGSLAVQFAGMGDTAKVKEVIEFLYKNMPLDQYPIDYVDVMPLQAAAMIQDKKWMDNIYNAVYDHTTKELDWLSSGTNGSKNAVSLDETRRYLSILGTMKSIMAITGDSSYIQKVDTKINEYSNSFGARLQ